MNGVQTSPLYRVGGHFRLLEAIERIGMTSAITHARRRAVEVLTASTPPNGRLLDVPCGTGPLLIDMAAALGPDALIVGVDQSQHLLRQADRRARNHGNVRLHCADWPTELAEAPFNGAVCCLGLTVMDSWEEALDALITAVLPGSPVVVIDWLTGPSDSALLKSYVRLGSAIANADPRRPVISSVSAALSDPWVETWPSGVALIGGTAPGAARKAVNHGPPTSPTCV